MQLQQFLHINFHSADVDSFVAVAVAATSAATAVVMPAVLVVAAGTSCSCLAALLLLFGWQAVGLLLPLERRC